MRDSHEEARCPDPKTFEEEVGNQAFKLITAITLPMVMRSAIELGLIDTIYAAGDGAFLSPSEIARGLPIKPTNPHAPLWLDRVLRALASYSVLRCRAVRTGDNVERLYGTTPICRFLVKNNGDVSSLANLLLWTHDDVTIKAWFRLKDMIVGGESAFNLAHGTSLFEYSKKDERYNKLFNNAMASHTTMAMKKVLEVYKGFEGVNVLVDVGGGIGTNLSIIATKYPNIKAINFDLPLVVADALPFPGVEHVGGDMFVQVPKGDAIFLKWIIHDWGDEAVLKLLQNCCQALPAHGKVIVVETILPEAPEDDLFSKITSDMDATVMSQYLGGKERTRKEFETLAKNSGFSCVKFAGRAYHSWVIEFYKTVDASKSK